MTQMTEGRGLSLALAQPSQASRLANEQQDYGRQGVRQMLLYLGKLLLG